MQRKHPAILAEVFKVIKTGCNVLGIHPSAAALRAKVGPVRKQIRTLALAYIQEHGLDGAANRLGAGAIGQRRSRRTW